MSQTKKDRCSTYQLTYRDHYKKKKRMTMGMGRRAEWAVWHEEAINDPFQPSSSSTPRPVGQPVAQTKFRSTAVGYDNSGIPLVDNKSGLGLGLGLNVGEKKSLLQFRQKKNAELLNYDPAIAKFVMGNGSQSQRASQVYNSTRAHSQALKAAQAMDKFESQARRRGQEDDGRDLTNYSLSHFSHAGSARMGVQSLRIPLFPRHPADEQPLNHLGLTGGSFQESGRHPLDGHQYSLAGSTKLFHETSGAAVGGLSTRTARTDQSRWNFLQPNATPQQQLPELGSSSSRRLPPIVPMLSTQM